MLNLYNNLFNELLAKKQGVELINWEEHRQTIKWEVNFFVNREREFYEEYSQHTVLVCLLSKKVRGHSMKTDVVKPDDVNIVNLGKYLEQQGFVLSTCKETGRMEFSLKTLVK